MHKNLSTAASYQEHAGKQQADIFPVVVCVSWENNSSKGEARSSAMFGFIYCIYLEQQMIKLSVG